MKILILGCDRGLSWRPTTGPLQFQNQSETRRDADKPALSYQKRSSSMLTLKSDRTVSDSDKTVSGMRTTTDSGRFIPSIMYVVPGHELVFADRLAPFSMTYLNTYYFRLTVMLYHSRASPSRGSGLRSSPLATYNMNPPGGGHCHGRLHATDTLSKVAQRSHISFGKTRDVITRRVGRHSVWIEIHMLQPSVTAPTKMSRADTFLSALAVLLSYHVYWYSLLVSVDLDSHHLELLLPSGPVCDRMALQTGGCIRLIPNIPG